MTNFNFIINLYRSKNFSNLKLDHKDFIQRFANLIVYIRG